MGILTYEYTIPIGDVGEKNYLTNNGFLRLMQESAIEASQSVGYGPKTTQETPFFWVILNWKLEVFKRPNWNDKILVKTWPRNMIKFYSHREFEIYDENQNIVAIASSKWVLVDKEKGVSKIPQILEDEYECVQKSVFNEESLSKIQEPEDKKLTLKYTVQRRDLDTNHHVNNTVYLDYAYEAIPQNVYENIDFKHVEIMYTSALSHRAEKQ